MAGKHNGTLTDQWEQAVARRQASGGTSVVPARPPAATPRERPVDPRFRAVNIGGERLTPRPGTAKAAVRTVVNRRIAEGSPVIVEQRAPVEPVKPGKSSDKLRDAARAVIEAWDGGELAPAVRALEAALGGTASIDGKRLRNQFHPSTYRKEYQVTLTGEDLMRLQLLTNAPSLTGPIGLTTYVVKPKEMEWARRLLAKIRAAK